MAARVDGLLDAVVASLAGADLSVEVTPTAEYRPTADMESLATTAVWVSPASRVSEMATRSQDDDTWAVYVAVAAKLPTHYVRSDMQALLELGDEIWSHLRRRDMAVAGARYAWRESATVPGADAGYSPEYVERLRCFLAVYRITYLAREG